jgi:hypothetical protein
VPVSQRQTPGLAAGHRLKIKGQLSAAEGELQEAWQMVAQSPEAGDFCPTVLHNLAAVEMRTGRYAGQ